MNTAFREFLNRPRALAAKLDEAEDQLMEMWTVCTKQTANYNSTGGHGGGGGDAKDGGMATYADLRSKQRALSMELSAAERDLMKLIDAVEKTGGGRGIRDAKILRMRYLFRMNWGEIHAGMAADGFHCSTLRTVLNWHSDALYRGERIWEERYVRTDE